MQPMIYTSPTETTTEAPTGPGTIVLVENPPGTDEQSDWRSDF